MLKYLAMECAEKLNYFPAKGGVSAYYSPYTIMSKKDLDFQKHCQVPFGAYVVGNQDNNPTNTNAPRGVDGIYLRPMNNLQGGHEILNLATGQKIERAHVWERPMSDFVIQAVEKWLKTRELNR